MHQVLFGTRLVLLVLSVLHVAGNRDGGSVLHCRLYDDALEALWFWGSSSHTVMR